jgi:hypothetical protein
MRHSLKLKKMKMGIARMGPITLSLRKIVISHFLYILKTKIVIRSDGPYLIRLRKPPSKENEGSESKKVGHTVGGDDFNRDVQQATSMMVNLIDNNKVNCFRGEKKWFIRKMINTQRAIPTVGITIGKKESMITCRKETW